MKFYVMVGLVMATAIAIPWLYVLVQMLVSAIKGYIRNDVWIRPKLFYAMFPKEASYYSFEWDKIRDSGVSKDRLMKGDHIWAWGMLGLLFMVGSIVAWPVMLVVLTLKGLRMYNTNEHFAKLFESKPKAPKAPKPAKVKRDNINYEV